MIRWKQNVRKNAIVHGLECMGTNGNIIPARTTGPPCECKERCFEKVDDKRKMHILTTFNNMPDKTTQDQYLSGLVLSFDPARVGCQGRKGKFSETNKGRRLNTFKYYVPKGNFFEEIYGIDCSQSAIFPWDRRRRALSWGEWWDTQESFSWGGSAPRSDPLAIHDAFINHF